MCDNIVVFGPTHSGKSTLMGYLVTYGMPDREYRQKDERHKQQIEEMGEIYKKDMALAYFVDTGRDERTTYSKGISSKGGSKRIHIKKAGMKLELNYTFIDTPGSDIAWKHKQEGVFLGDIGIFVVEIGKLVELSRKVKGSNSYNMMRNQLFSPIYLWKHYKRMKRLIIAISKVDLQEYSQFALKRAEDILRSVDILQDVSIIPVSIDVEKRKGNNIVNEADGELGWYKGKTLLDEIKNLLEQEKRSDPQDQTLIAHIERLFRRTQSNSQPAVRVKVLNGNIRVGDEIYLGPVKSNMYGPFLKGKVFSLKHETEGETTVLSKGEIGGIIFSKVWSDRDRVKLTDVDLKRTSMVYNESEENRKGNLLYFCIDKQKLGQEARQKLEAVRIGGRISIIWFGKIISMHIISKLENDQECKVVIMNTAGAESLFILPLKKNGKFFFEEFVLQLEEYCFVTAVFSDLEMISEEEPRNICYSFEGQIDNLAQCLRRSRCQFTLSYDSKENLTSILWINLTDKVIVNAIKSMMTVLKENQKQCCKVEILPGRP